MIANLSEVYFGSKQENWFLWAIIPVQTDENYGEEWVLTWYFRWGYIHQFQPDHSYNSIGATEAPNLNISCMQGSHRSEKSKRNIIFNMAWESHGKSGNLKIFWQVVRENQGIKKKKKQKQKKTTTTTKTAILLMQIGIAKCLIFVTVLYKDMIEHFKTSIYCLGF